VVHSYAGYENRVKTNLESRIQSLNMEDYIYQIEVPVHQVTEIKGGKRQQVSEKVLPGYILVRMDLTDESWAVVRNTPGVTGFVGLSSRPSPLQLGEVAGLLALMLLHDARRAGRQTAGGDIVLLEEQDRSLWDQTQIAEGVRLVEEALRLPGRPEAYAVQAAIAALHARAPNFEDTDWRQIAGLYEVLLRISPSPVIELNHERLRERARLIGPATAAILDRQWHARLHPEQTLRRSLGILRLARDFSPARLEAACARALELQALSYRAIRALIDAQPAPSALAQGEPIAHDNLRGPTYFR